ncbi:MAG: hypothetical protein ACRECL_15125 [Bradyrhizobium sp.]
MVQSHLAAPGLQPEQVGMIGLCHASAGSTAIRAAGPTIAANAVRL